MTYSKTHQRFADRLNNQRALEHPEEFLGPNWKDVLNFWWFLDGFSEEQRKIVWERYQALDDDVWDSARDAADDAACVAAGNACVAAYAACVAAYAAWDAAYVAAAVSLYATYELIGSHRLLEQGKPLTFLLLFLDL
jgi:hypothetical protein